MDSRQYDSDVVEIDLGEILGLLLSRAWFIILCAVLTAIIGFSISKFVVTELYQSTTSVYILNKQDSSTLTYSDVQLGTQLTKDYANLITSRSVLEKVIEDCGLDTTYAGLNSRVSVETLSDTRILEITVTDEDPEMAQFIANEVRKEAATHITNVMDIQAVNVVDEANLPTSPSSPNVPKWTLIGFLIGAFISMAVVIVKFMLDDTVKTSDDVERYLGLSTLGMIPVREDPEKSKHSSRRSSNRESSARTTRTSQPKPAEAQISDKKKAAGMDTNGNDDILEID
jgi:capsular polysaccharide biosynthesis protein